MQSRRVGIAGSLRVSLRYEFSPPSWPGRGPGGSSKDFFSTPPVRPRGRGRGALRWGLLSTNRRSHRRSAGTAHPGAPRERPTQFRVRSHGSGIGARDRSRQPSSLSCRARSAGLCPRTPISCQGPIQGPTSLCQPPLRTGRIDDELADKSPAPVRGRPVNTHDAYLQ